VSAIGVTKAQPTPPINSYVTDRAGYYLWCGSNICVRQPPESYRGHVANYFPSITPNIFPPSTRRCTSRLELVRWAATTSGSTSFSSGMRESINGNIGFMGEAPTASIGGGAWDCGQRSDQVFTQVDIAAYPRSNSATFMFNINQPSTIAATSSVEIYVQALFRLEGFSPEYLAYLNYSQGQPLTTTASVDPKTGLRPLSAANISAWKSDTPQTQETLLKIRATEYTEAIQFGFQISHYGLKHPPHIIGHRPLRNSDCRHHQRCLASLSCRACCDHASSERRRQYVDHDGLSDLR
jgi:hypothetical protein